MQSAPLHFDGDLVVESTQPAGSSLPSAQSVHINLKIGLLFLIFEHSIKNRFEIDLNITWRSITKVLILDAFVASAFKHSFGAVIQ